nr:BCCT family transporter [Eubacterium callanderi]
MGVYHRGHDDLYHLLRFCGLLLSHAPDEKNSTDISLTKIPKALNAAVAIFMGVLTMVLLFVGGYDALNQVIVALGFPAVIFTLIVLIAGVKFILHRDKYDATYIEEMEEAARTTKIE